MQVIKKELKLAQIKAIGDLVNIILSLPVEDGKIKAGDRYKIDRWGEKFTEKLELINKEHNKILFSYNPEGSLDFSDPKFEECSKELTNFYNTLDIIDVSFFDLSWIEQVNTPDIRILKEFMDIENFKEQSTLEEDKNQEYPKLQD